MKILQKTLLAVAAGTLMTAGAQAAVNYGNTMAAQPYFGAKVGQYDLDGAKDKGTSYGVYGGAKFTPNFGVEAEYLTTSDEDFTNTTEYSADTYGLYATADYAFPNTGGLYGKGRLGVAKNEVDVEGKNINYKTSGSDTGVAGGLGLGFNVAPNASIEAMYNWYPTVEISNKDYDASGVSLGAHFKF
ncbi:porin family protein [Psychrobacter phenylpyruvicus]|uniref:Outer membrane protein beta-barrel domain-containing protein n=1 Tax=Psychrobacter phenylpyruvicus TaxID=29432 RepID=A0A379LNJ3_9GAMM|nr:porin family protein [Psychrobacter phenylpyruvicus]SUD92123.1 Uncharacterised protein [Psychrobacter phenylpyruvicus]